MSSLTYRPEIDGLRAVAVSSVLIFHINSQALPGGFVGVDIFFVISGYLISLILLKEIKKNGHVNYRDFYRKRIKRILPSAFTVILTSLCAGALILLPRDFSNLAKSVIPSLLFASNFHFSTVTDYFASKSNELPLMHLWSLAIEEQFYLAWPPLLFILSKVKNSRIVFAICIGLIYISTQYAQILSLNDISRNTSYFSPFARSGELLIGCLTAYSSFYFKPNLNKITHAFLLFLSAIILLLSILFIDKNSVFPGFISWAPCIATALIIWSSSYLKENFIVTALSSKPLVTVGLYSYVLYLWHWPILALYRYYFVTDDLSHFEGAICLLLSGVFSFLSRKLAEIPLNSVTWSFKKVVIWIFFIPTMAIASLASIVVDRSGLLRFPLYLEEGYLSLDVLGR